MCLKRYTGKTCVCCATPPPFSTGEESFVYATPFPCPFQRGKKVLCMLRHSPALFKGGGTGAGSKILET